MFKFIVIDNKPLTSTSNLLTLKNESGRAFNFSPGQYAAISFSNGFRPTTFRCFSLSNSPTDHGVIEFSTRTSGKFTKALTGLQSGDFAKIIGPFGGFTLDVSNDQKLYFFAGGIGITPFISMLKYIEALSLKNQVVLIYSVRDLKDAPYLQYLLNLQKSLPNLKVQFVVSGISTSNQKNVIAGRINKNIVQNLLDEENSLYYICGPALYMQSVKNLLLDEGVQDYQIYNESFTQGSKMRSLDSRWPKRAYITAAIVIAIAAISIMVSDLIKYFPKVNNSNNVLTPSSGSTRQSTVDNSINSLQNGNSSSTSTNSSSNTNQPVNNVPSSNTVTSPTTSSSVAP